MNDDFLQCVEVKKCRINSHEVIKDLISKSKRANSMKKAIEKIDQGKNTLYIFM